MAQSPAPTAAFLASHLLGCSTLWASGFLFMKLAGEADPFVIAAMRGLVGAASLGAFFLAQGRSVRPRGREWRDWAVLGAFNGWGPNVLVAFALTQITTATASMIQAASPLVVAAAAHVMFAEERLSARRALGVVVGFVGMGVLIGPAAIPGGGVGAAGGIAMLVVAVSYAVGNLYARAVPAADPARLALGQQMFSGGPATILALVLIGPTAFAPVPAHAASLAALGIVATAVPILLFMRLIRFAGPTRAAMVGYLMPVFTTILGILFLGEQVGARELAGGAIVLCGVALVSVPGRIR